MPGHHYASYKYFDLLSDSKITIRCRKWLKRILIDLILLAVIAALVLVWAFAVEPSMLTVTNLEIADEKLPEEMDGMRVVFFSDLHVGSCFSEAEAERVAVKIKNLHPDVLLFGGDLTQYEPPENRPDVAHVAAAFAKIEPRWGKYAVYGNHDIDAKGTAFEILSKSGFKVLENRSVRVAEGFYVAGTSPWPRHLAINEENAEDESGATWPVSNGYFTILLAHEPAQIDDFSKYPFALQLSGHTHYGQVALPFIGPLSRVYATNGYVAGLFHVNDTTMYVTRGVGVIDMHVRFFAPPEIVVVTLKKAEKG